MPTPGASRAPPAAQAYPDVLKHAIGKWKAANGCTLPPLAPWDMTYRFNVPRIFGFSPTSFAPPKDWEPFDYVARARGREACAQRHRPPPAPLTREAAAAHGRMGMTRLTTLISLPGPGPQLKCVAGGSPGRLLPPPNTLR